MRGIVGLGRVRVSFVGIVRGTHRMNVVINLIPMSPFVVIHSLLDRHPLLALLHPAQVLHLLRQVRQIADRAVH